MTRPVERVPFDRMQLKQEDLALTGGLTYSDPADAIGGRLRQG